MKLSRKKIRGFTPTPIFASLRRVFSIPRLLWVRSSDNEASLLFNNATKTPCKNRCRGFTLIELLVVVSIISLISSIVMAAVNSSRAKARDTRRASDMHQIILALNLFYSENGCLPKTSGSDCPGINGYNDANSGGWDYSSQGTGFMAFLKDGNFISSGPSDPINNMTGDGSPSGTYAYRYYCYSGPAAYGPSLSYFKESGSWANVPILIPSALAANSNYICK